MLLKAEGYHTAEYTNMIAVHSWEGGAKHDREGTVKHA
jgi:hypothetical protein